MSILLREASVERRHTSDDHARPTSVLRVRGPIRLDVVLFCCVAYCAVAGMEIAFVLMPSTSQASDLMIFAWHSFMALFTGGVTYCLIHHLALEEAIVVSADSTARWIMFCGRPVRQQRLQHIDGVALERGRLAIVSRTYTEVNGAILGLDEQPHGVVLRSGDRSLWVGRQLWTHEDRRLLDEAMRTALREHQVQLVAADTALPLSVVPIRRLRVRRGRCPKCGYDRAGLNDPAAPCPECGAAAPY